MLLQPLAVPGAGAQVHVAVGALLVAVLAPVARRERLEVERAVAPACEVLQRAGGGAVVEILQHALTDDQVEALPPERGLRVEVDHRALRPAEALAQVGAELDAVVLRARPQRTRGGAPVAVAAADVEDRAHVEVEILQVGGDETRQHGHALGVGDARRRVVVEAAVVLRAEAIGRRGRDGAAAGALLHRGSASWRRRPSDATARAGRSDACRIGRQSLRAPKCVGWQPMLRRARSPRGEGPRAPPPPAGPGPVIRRPPFLPTRARLPKSPRAS